MLITFFDIETSDVNHSSNIFDRMELVCLIWLVSCNKSKGMEKKRKAKTPT